MTDYPIEKIRQQFLALHHEDEEGQLPLFFDGPGGSQLPKNVVKALSYYLSNLNSNMGGQAYAGKMTAEFNQSARKVAGRWLGADADNMIFGLNATSLMFQVARSLKNTWQVGDNIVLSSMDHFSHVSSWQTAAEECAVDVRFIPLVDDGSQLDLTTLDQLIDERTKLVAVTLASNVLGTITEIEKITNRAKDVGAVLSVDAVHAIVHRRVNVQHLHCDLVFASTYKMGGARLGFCYMSDDLLQTLRPYKVQPASNKLPMAWEQGTQSFEAQVALTALWDYWTSIGTDDNGKARENLLLPYRLVHDYERTLSEYFLQELGERDYLTLYGLPTINGRTPTFAFNLHKHGKIINPAKVSKWLGGYNVALSAGNFYAQGVATHLQLEKDGFLRAGLLHYNTQDEITQLFNYLDDYIAQL